MKRLSLYAVSLFSILITLLFCADHLHLHGEMRFKDFKSDRERFERNIERAKDSLTEEEWQNIVNTGREALSAEWERAAKSEAERYIRKGFSDEDVEEAKRKSFDDWEREYDRAAALEKGRWYALRENIIYEGTELNSLKEGIAAVKDSSSLDEWDRAVEAALEGAENNWKGKYLPEIEILRSKGTHLTGGELAGFEQEITRIEKELKRYFGLEMGSMLYLSRNKFITDLFYDRNSLRTRSEGESASVITEQVIQGVINDLKKDEEAILKRSFEAGQIEGIDPSRLGNDWQEEIKRLVETGMKRWASAREELYRGMVSWKGGAEESYESAEARWKKAALALEKARGEWEEKLTGEIYAGIGKWKYQENELNLNIENAQKDFQAYVETVRSQWEDQSRGLMTMAVNGSKVYGEGVDNIKWLQKMCENYHNTGAFGEMGEVKQGDDDFGNILSPELNSEINEIIARLPEKQFYHDLYKTGKQKYNSSNPSNPKTGIFYYTGSYYTYEYTGSEGKKDNQNNWYLEEKYTVKLYGEKNTYAIMPVFDFGWGGNSSSEYRNYYWLPSSHLLKSFEVVNRVNLESLDAEKSTYFYYKTELERWKSLKETFGKIALDAEKTMGENMTGNPGFLVNADGKYELNDPENRNDPYLMTKAEYDYELAKRDKQFWEKRLAIAKSVYDYAYPADGRRESAEATENNKALAEDAMIGARDRYNEALRKSSEILKELKNIQSGEEGSIEELANMFEAARVKLVNSEEDYLGAKTALIAIENGENHEYIKKEIDAIERNIAETEKGIADKRLEYMKALRDFEAASRGYEFSEKYIEADEGRRSAESSLNNFITENSGVIDEANLEKYFALKLEYERGKKIADAMLDKDFKADDFLKLENELNPEVYSRYAGYSLEALRKINDAIDEFEPEEGGDNSGGIYENVKGYIESIADELNFAPGQENSEYIIIRTALRIFEEKYKGLTPEGWGAYKNKIDEDLTIAEAIDKFYTEEYDDFYISDADCQVNNEEWSAVSKIREYYYPGSAIAGFEEIIRYDREDEFDFKKHETLKLHVAENYDYFYSTEKAGGDENYLDGMIGFIIHKTGYSDEIGIELNGVEGFNIRNLSPVQMSLAVDAVCEYMEGLEKGGITVPRYIEETYNSLLASKERLDLYLYIEDYVSGRHEGTADEIYNSAKKRGDAAEEMRSFIFNVGDLLEVYGMDDDAVSMHIISMYMALSEDSRGLAEGIENDGIKSAVETISALTGVVEKGEIYSIAAMYLQFGESGNLEDFAALQGLEDEKKNVFLGYMNELNSTGEEGWEKVMIDLALLEQERGALLGLLYSHLPGALDAADKEYKESLSDLSKAGGLCDFTSGSGEWESWRDSVLNVDRDGFRFSSAPVEHETSIYDERSDEGLKSKIKYSLETIEKDERVFSRSLIIDEANRLEGIFNSLFEASEYSADYNVIEAVLDSIDRLKENYTAEDLNGSLNGFKTVYSTCESAVEDSASELYSMEMMLGQCEQGLVDKRKTYDYLSGGSTDRNTAQKNLETAREAHETVKREYESVQTMLNEAQKLYNEKNSEYIGKMNEASQLYAEFRNLEFEYEKAYSRWEYGNTPYLKGEGAHDSGFNHGTMPGTDGDTTAEFAELDLPDARDNYERIEARYNEVLAEFNEKKKAKESQETVESLQGDEEYRRLKGNLLRKSEEYIRASQVDLQIGEDSAKYKKDYEESAEEYECSKERVKFYKDRITVKEPDEDNAISSIVGAIIVSEELSDAEKGELKKERDIFLYHVSKYGLDQYMSALTNYSSYRIIDTAGGDSYQGNIDSANAFNNLPQELKDSVITMYDIFRSYGSALDNIYMYYQDYKKWENTAADSRRRWKKTSKARFITRNNRKNDYYDDCAIRDNYKSKYYHQGYEPLRETLEDFLIRRNDYAKKSETYKGITEVLSLDELKAYLKQSKYNLTDEDLSYLYDESNLEGFKITEESINLAVTRNEERRSDIDGEGVYAKIIDGKISLLDKDGNHTGTTYDLDDPGIKLKPVEGETYELYDRSYDILNIAGLIKKRAEDERGKHYAALMEYMKKSADEGKHDFTVMLRDMERSFSGYGNVESGNGYIGLIKTAVNFNRTTDEGEIRQRSFEGYSRVTKEYIENIQTMVLDEMIKQNRSFQVQLWQQQREKFTERKDRWMEVTGYIFNRGNRDWSVKMSEFNHQWAKWRFEARREIETGEEWWLEQDKGMREEMDRWNEEASKAGSKAAVENMYHDLEGRVSDYEKKIKGNIPTGGNFNIDTSAMLKNALSRIPEMSIGVLNNSMSAVDTTAGLSNLLNLGLSGALFIHNEKEMALYEQAHSVMQNMRVLDILNAILDGFNEQLEGANESLYDAVFGISKSESLISAPFMRHENERAWTIRVCVASNLTGDKYKTRRFADYKDYENSTVFLKPLKGIGQEIDFTKPSSYINIDKEELEVYVGLAGEWLSRGIDEVFKEDGLFSQHQEREFEGLAGNFEKYYIEWKEGEMMRGLGIYNKPIIGNGPSILVSMSIGAQIAGTLVGGPGGAAIGAVIMGTVNSGIGIADGTTSWKHAGAQMGTGLLTSGSGMFAPIVGGTLQGIDYKEGGSIGWSKKGFKDGMKQGVKEFGVRTLAMNMPVFSDIAASWVDTEGGWTDFNFDNDNWSDHIFAGLNSGFGSAGIGGQLIGETLRTATYNLLDGKGFSEEGQGSFNWDQFKLTARDVGSNLISALDYLYNGEQEDSKPDTSDPLSKAEVMLGGWWESIRREYEEGGLLAGAMAVAGGYAGNVMSGISQGYEDAKQSWTFMNAIGGFGAIDSAIGYVKDFSGWAKNSFTGFLGGTEQGVRGNESVTKIKLEEEIRRLKEKERNIRTIELISMLKEYQQMVTEGEDANIDKDRSGKWYSVFSSTDEAIDYINTKKELGIPLDHNDARMLAQTMWQSKDGQLGKEFSKFIMNNKDKFAGFQLEGLDMNNEKSIRAFADKIAYGSCFINTVFMNVILSQEKVGVPQSWGEMYLKALDGGLLHKDGIKTTQYMNRKEGIQNWVDTLIGKDRLVVEGLFLEDKLSSSDIFRRIPELYNSGVLASGGRFLNNRHSMMQFLVNGNWGIFDTGWRRESGARPYGGRWDRWYKDVNSNSFWILRNK